MPLSSGFERIAGLRANRFTPKELSDPSREFPQPYQNSDKLIPELSLAIPICKMETAVPSFEGCSKGK